MKCLGLLAVLVVVLIILSSDWLHAFYNDDDEDYDEDYDEEEI